MPLVLRPVAAVAVVLISAVASGAAFAAPVPTARATARPHAASRPAAHPATPRPTDPPVAAVGTGRNDYANPAFVKQLDAGLVAFYARDFKTAQGAFEKALLVIPDDTLALSFLDASAAQQPGALEVLTNVGEDAVTGAPKNVVNHVRLGFTYLFQGIAGRDRSQDARDEFNAALAIDPTSSAAHVGLGVMRFDERSANRAKAEMYAALRTNPNDVLAREYLGQLYQNDLRDPERGLTLEIDVPNLVPHYADIDFHIASVLYELKQYDAAVRYATTGLALDTGRVGEAGQHGDTLLAQIYLDQHRLADAKRVLTDAVAADADAIYARTLLARIAAGDYDQEKHGPIAEPVTPEPDATSASAR